MFLCFPGCPHFRRAPRQNFDKGTHPIYSVDSPSKIGIRVMLCDLYYRYTFQFKFLIQLFPVDFGSYKNTRMLPIHIFITNICILKYCQKVRNTKSADQL